MQPGTRLGPYEILSKIGEGGMGAVYKARDTRLDRIVAIKRSAEAFNERFEREAQAIAALNHPHICTLYDVGSDYLVMELVDGKPLAGPLPVEDAVRYAIQIADALDAAHRRGITHRDLKPANILLTKAGVKLLDFGLAKRAEPADSQETQAANLTNPGMILGTPQYMSPEQVEGVEADARSDIFSFGAILYELITGRKAFEGKTASSMMAAVLRETPAAITEAQPSLTRIITRCLEKDPDNRFQNARDIKHALEDMRPAEPKQIQSRSIKPWIAAAVAILALIAISVAYHLKPVPTMPAYHLSITPPPGTEFDFGVETGGSAISSDGRMLAFCAGNSLWVRDLNGGEARKLPHTEGARFPFWSPDSKLVGFLDARSLKRIDLASGATQEITTCLAGRGASWNSQGLILYAELGQGIRQVQSSGGTPTPATKIDKARHEVTHYWPWFLPGGDRFLYVVRSGDLANAGIYVGSLKDPALKVRVSQSQYSAVFVPASGEHPSYLLFANDGSLFAQAFDPERLAAAGEPVLIGPVGVHPAYMRANFSASSSGSIVLGRQGQSKVQLTWLDRQGRVLGSAGPADVYLGIQLSPDGSRVAVRRDELGGFSSLWIYEFSRGVLSPLAPIGMAVAWVPDSKELIYLNNAAGTVFRKRIDSNGPGEALFQPKTTWVSLDWSSDGNFVVVGRGQVVRLAGSGPQPSQLDTSASFSRFSPDGKWIAYSADGRTTQEVFVQSFPDPETRWQVSTQGGNSPVWRRDGKELFYRSTDGQLMAVTIKPGPGTLAFDSPRALFALKTAGFYSYDAAPDGQRFLVRMPVENEKDRSELTILTNWRDALPKPNH